MRLTANFKDHASIYPTFEEIPDQYLLEQYTNSFAGRDVWSEYYACRYESRDYDQEYLDRIALVENSWRSYCTDIGQHHALASPNMINDWCERLLNDVAYNTVWKCYLVRLNEFYRYLLWNVDYPHTYNPVQFSIQECETTKRVSETDWRNSQ